MKKQSIKFESKLTKKELKRMKKKKQKQIKLPSNFNVNILEPDFLKKNKEGITKIRTFRGSGNVLSSLPAGMNREVDIDSPKRKELLKSMMEHGWIPQPIIVIETDIFGEGMKKYIIDGQHRYATVKRIYDAFGVNLTGTYVIYGGTEIKSPHDFIRLISTINTTSLSWNTMNYICTYAHCPDYVNAEDYRELKELILNDKYSFNSGNAETLGGMAAGHIKKKANLISSGNFEIDREAFNKLISTLDYLKSLHDNYIAPNKLKIKFNNSILPWINYHLHTSDEGELFRSIFMNLFVGGIDDGTITTTKDLQRLVLNTAHPGGFKIV